MKKSLLLFLLAGFLGLLVAVAQVPAKPAKRLRHVVTVTFKPGSSPKEIKEVDDSFNNLAVKLKVVKGYEWGISPIDKHNKANRHVYVSSFASEEDMAAYGASPEHQKHIQLGRSIIESVSAVDYWLNR